MKRIVSMIKSKDSSYSTKRLVCSLLAFVALIGTLSTGVMADIWDGVGAVTDGNVSSNIVGDFTLPYVSENAVLGYQFF